MGLMIDSTVLVEAERRKRSPADLNRELIDRWGDVDAAISVMSAGELLHGWWRGESPSRRSRRGEFIEGVLNSFDIVPITLPVMRIFAEIDAKLTARGEKLPTSDLLIACTALERGDEVVTGNLRHYARVPDLVVHVA